MDTVAQKQAQVVSYRLPSFGTYSASLSVSYWFGLARNVQDSGLNIDIDHSANMVDAKNSETRTRINYVRLLGTQGSAMEHGVPELIYSTGQAPTDGVSAVKLLALANQLGMKVYSINNANLNVILPLLIVDASVKNEISNAASAGKEVVISQSNLTLGSWTGVGYTITDPLTGAGAYKISGGTNGGFLEALKWLVKGYVVKLAATAHILGLDDIAGTVGRWGSLAGFVIGLIDIALKCAGNADAFSNVVTAYTLATLLAIAATAFLAIFIGFWWVLLAGIFLAYVVGLIKNWLVNNFGCLAAQILRARITAFA